MSSVRNALAVVCAALFVVSAPLALLLFNLEQGAFNPATYQAALADQDLYVRMPGLLGSLLASKAGSSGIPFLSQLTTAQWAGLIRDVLPPDELKQVTDEAITQIFAYINGQAGDARLSLAPLKQNLASPLGLKAAVDLIQSQPACTVGQLAQMAASLGGVLCDPPRFVLDLARPALQAQMSAAASLIPAELSLLSGTTRSPRLANLRWIRLAMRLSPLLPLALLFVLTVLAVRSFKGWLAWWGWPLCLAGGLGALAAFAGAPFFSALAEQYISRRLALSLPADLGEAVRSVADSALRAMLRPAGWQALTLAGCGLVLILLAAFVGRHGQDPARAASEAKTEIF